MYFLWYNWYSFFLNNLDTRFVNFTPSKYLVVCDILAYENTTFVHKRCNSKYDQSETIINLAKFIRNSIDIMTLDKFTIKYIV
jgi:hypothetical protein